VKHANANISSEDIRAAIARCGIPAYIVAARARIHPMKLSRLSRGHDPITPAVASRILLAISQEAAVHGR